MRVATETDRPRGPPGKYPSSYIIIAYYDRSRVGTEPRPVARRGYLDRVRVQEVRRYYTIRYRIIITTSNSRARKRGRFKLKTTLLKRPTPVAPGAHRGSVSPSSGLGAPVPGARRARVHSPHTSDTTRIRRFAGSRRPGVPYTPVSGMSTIVRGHMTRLSWELPVIGERRIGIILYRCYVS